jgi:hypothetical protein
MAFCADEQRCTDKIIHNPPGVLCLCDTGQEECPWRLGCRLDDGAYSERCFDTTRRCHWDIVCSDGTIQGPLCDH